MQRDEFVNTPVDGRTVYVPAADSHYRTLIDAGSGIVGTPMKGTDQRILIDYEGNRYGAANMKTYEERVLHAYDRHVWHGTGYPTVARALVGREEMIEVGFILTSEEPSFDEVAAILRRRYHGFAPPQAVRAVQKEMAKPQVVIDRQDLVDEWCGSPHLHDVKTGEETPITAEQARRAWDAR